MIPRRSFLSSATLLLAPSFSFASVSSWSQTAEAEADPIVKEILSTGFIPQALSGKLSLKAFLTYLEQNSIYLRNYAEVLSRLSRITKNKKERDFLAKNAKDTLELLAYTADLYQRMADRKLPQTIKPSAVTRDYSNSEVESCENGSYAVALAAVYPCFWVYGEVGKFIKKVGFSKNNPYGEWLEGFLDPVYLDTVNEIRSFLNDNAAASNIRTRKRMTEAFLKGVQFEKEFFESALVRNRKM